MSRPDPTETGAIAKAAADRLLDDLHILQVRHGGQTAVAAAIACAANVIGFALDATGAEAAQPLLDMLCGAAERRQDRLKPTAGAGS